MSHIFISYSHKDKEYVHKLHDALVNEGFDVWIDDRIDYGDKWLKAIEKNLDECDAFIIVMSKNSSESEMVQNEITRARDLEKQIFPLLLDGNNWLVVQSRQFVDVRDGALPAEKFYKRLESVTQRKNKNPDIEEVEREKKQGKTREKNTVLESTSVEEKPARKTSQIKPKPVKVQTSQRKWHKQAAIWGIGFVAVYIIGMSTFNTFSRNKPLISIPTPSFTSLLTNTSETIVTQRPEIYPTDTELPAQDQHDVIKDLAFFEFDETNNCRIVFKNSVNDFLLCPELPKPDIDFIESHWSPDGRYVEIHYNRTRNNENYIYVVSINQKTTYSVVSDVAATFGDFSWLANTGKLFFYEDGGNGVLRLSRFDIDTEKYTTVIGLTSGLSQYSISPNGEKIAFQSYPGGDYNIYVNSILSGQTVSKAVDASKLTNFQGGEYCKDIGWIDNETIFYSMGNDDIYTTLISDHNPRKVGNGVLPVLSRDRQKLLFYSDGLAVFDFVKNQFLPISVQNDMKTAYTNATWSLDSKYIALIYENQLVIYSLLENSLITIMGQFNSPGNIVWSFDNNYIAFTAEQDGVSSVFVATKDGSDVMKISGESNALFPMWIPP